MTAENSFSQIHPISMNTLCLHQQRKDRKTAGTSSHALEEEQGEFQRIVSVHIRTTEARPEAGKLQHCDDDPCDPADPWVCGVSPHREHSLSPLTSWGIRETKSGGFLSAWESFASTDSCEKGNILSWMVPHLSPSSSTPALGLCSSLFLPHLSVCLCPWLLTPASKKNSCGTSGPPAVDHT